MKCYLGKTHSGNLYISFSENELGIFGVEKILKERYGKRLIYR